MVRIRSHKSWNHLWDKRGRLSSINTPLMGVEKEGGSELGRSAVKEM